AFSSKDPAKAAKIVNAIVDTYLEAGIAGKVKSTKIASKVSKERVDELKRQLVDADRALLEYKNASVANQRAALALSHAQISLLDSAAIAMAEAKARMERAASVGTENSSIPDNELITRLRGQLSDLSMRAKDIESRVGKNHLAAIKVRDQMADLREAI